MKRMIIIAIVSLAIGGLAGWLGHEWRTGVILADCAVVEIKVRLQENIEMMRVLQKGDIDSAKHLAQRRLQSTVRMTDRYGEAICTRAGSTLCKSLMEIIHEARQLVELSDEKN